MNPAPPFTLGIDTLLNRHADWLSGQRVGLVSHAAAVDQQGMTSADKLHGALGDKLTALFGPEHGFAGTAWAGELTSHEHHARWDIPVYSLYGETRKPTPDMLDSVDTLIVEFQDLGARPYTYVSTMRLVLEAATEARKTVIIADRPVPLPRGMDGPMMNSAFESFVGFIPGPMQYGMTPGETATWLAQTLGLTLDLRVAPMAGYHRDTERQTSWPPWVPPSPRIRSWESACLFTCMVFGEALPALDYGSGTVNSFLFLGAPWLNARQLATHLEGLMPPGVSVQPERYRAMTGSYAGTELDGLRLAITDYAAFRPVSSAVTLLATIQALHGKSQLWDAPGTRPEWFDKLFGTDTLRRGLQSGTPASEIIASWQADLNAFAEQRSPHLLYSAS